jgi:hypothetical protein
MVCWHCSSGERIFGEEDRETFSFGAGVDPRRRHASPMYAVYVGAGAFNVGGVEVSPRDNDDVLGPASDVKSAGVGGIDGVPNRAPPVHRRRGRLHKPVSGAVGPLSGPGPCPISAHRVHLGRPALRFVGVPGRTVWCDANG